jgi:transposase, IS30 family
MPGARMSVIERGQIEVLLREGLSKSAIARRLGRSPSTICREVSRYRRACRGYDGRWAHARARENARRPRARKLVPTPGRANPPLRIAVAVMLQRGWSPAQISARLSRVFPQYPEYQVSPETIYQAIYLQSRGSLRKEIAHQVALRSGRSTRRAQSRQGGAAHSNRPWISGLHISTRPAEVADRAVPGHWEGDLLIGARSASAIITLVERSSRFVMLGALPQGRVSEHVQDVLIALMRRVPAELAKTITWDQGAEMAAHARFTLSTDCRLYFCDPHSPWQRGSNENTNGLLRQYFPRSSTDFRTYTQADLDEVARLLNGRPRQTLDWQTPTEKLNEFLVATAA